ncbi:hypothetical protein [Nostoc sp. ChiQUE01b]|uniref:hypothetical protein n=1 Tax=Nostoc sp. ChiQUE01b TaxID=3075376 RepID=UPI002AD224DC|nr:hypothetical protein [Nostoc sp. ChiQUE01b]MDZ8260553.1 hypothetical protein [Nostoc sp. ChiQUE01b]
MPKYRARALFTYIQLSKQLTALTYSTQIAITHFGNLRRWEVMIKRNYFRIGICYLQQ